MLPILNLVKSKGQRKSKLEVKRKEWKSHIDIGNWYWQHWIQATFPAAPAHHPPKPCAGNGQKVRSKTSSATHLFALSLWYCIYTPLRSTIPKSNYLRILTIAQSNLQSFQNLSPRTSILAFASQLIILTYSIFFD